MKGRWWRRRLWSLQGSPPVIGLKLLSQHVTMATAAPRKPVFQQACCYRQLTTREEVIETKRKRREKKMKNGERIKQEKKKKQRTVKKKSETKKENKRSIVVEQKGDAAEMKCWRKRPCISCLIWQRSDSWTRFLYLFIDKFVCWPQSISNLWQDTGASSEI